MYLRNSSLLVSTDKHSTSASNSALVHFTLCLYFCWSMWVAKCSIASEPTQNYSHWSIVSRFYRAVVFNFYRICVCKDSNPWMATSLIVFPAGCSDTLTILAFALGTDGESSPQDACWPKSKESSSATSGLLADINSTGCCIWLASLSQERPTVLFWRMCLVVSTNLKIPHGYVNRTAKHNGCNVRDKKPHTMFCLQIAFDPEALSIQKNFWIPFFLLISEDRHLWKSHKWISYLANRAWLHFSLIF